jgi:hypothetical protein
MMHGQVKTGTDKTADATKNAAKHAGEHVKDAAGKKIKRQGN